MTREEALTFCGAGLGDPGQFGWHMAIGRKDGFSLYRFDGRTGQYVILHSGVLAEPVHIRAILAALDAGKALVVEHAP